MAFRTAEVIVAGGLWAALAGCGSDALPEGIRGSFTRQEAELGGLRTHTLELNLTSTGMTVTGPGMGASQSVSVGGTPVLGGSIKLGVAPGSALFKKITCADDASCRFTTESTCEGTISRDVSGAIVLVAVGDCETWSGKWTPAKAGDAAASASATATTATTTAEPAATAAPAPIPTAPATATPSTPPATTGAPAATATGTATAAPTATATSEPALNVSCLAKCNEASFACVRECKIGDLDCMKACSAKVSDCAQKCP